jgi:spoIIIJ-associated protein
MNFKEFSGKDENELLETASTELNIPKENLIYKKTITKGGLLKKDTINIYVTTLDDVVVFIKDYLKSLTKDMGLDVQFESKIREEQITIKMYSNNNSILIGHNGQTLKALTTVVKQVIYNEIGEYPYLILDVENYKEKQVKYLERLAKNIAREVGHTKNPVELENMNSYERRIIHNILSDNKYVYTESIGEEPNRHVVVKPKED